MEQTEQYYRALKMRKIPTAMIRLTDGWHSRSLPPSNFMRVQLYLRKWFSRFAVEGETSTDSMPVFWRGAETVGVALAGFSLFSFPVVTAAYVRDHVDARAFGAAFGMLTIFYGPGAMLGPQLGGIIGDSADSFTPVYLLVAAVAVAGALFAASARPPRALGSAA